MFKFITSTLLLAVVANATNDHDRHLSYFRQSTSDLSITVTNIAYFQPFSPFFAVVHNSDATPLFQLGEPAMDQLALLAEDGNTDPLVEFYTTDDDESTNILSAATVTDGFIGRGESQTFTLTIDRDFPFVSFASMAVNTNDCFVGISSMYLRPGQTLYVPGYDAGSEENNELCASVPGPACDMATGNVRSGNGEGAVHIHRGVHGIGDLALNETDWRNPMLLVTVEAA